MRGRWRDQVVGGRQVSDALDQIPRPLRWFLTPLLSIIRFGRAIVWLTALAGLVGIVVGAVTLDPQLALRAFGQLLLAGIVLGINLSGEEVAEARGPRGAFIIRTKRRRVWHNANGWSKVVAYLRGDYAWRVTIRRRQEDPLGKALLVHVFETENAAQSAVSAMKQRISHGEELVGSENEAQDEPTP